MQVIRKRILFCVIATAVAALLCVTAAGSTTMNLAVKVPRGVPAWALHGHGTWIQDNTPMPGRMRQLAEVPATCPNDPTKSPTWHGAAYVFWAIVKKLPVVHIKVVLWKVHQKIAECHDGTYVTYFFRVRWPDIPPLPVIDHLFYINPWRFDGWVDAGFNCARDDCYDPAPNQQTRIVIARGSFSACLITKFLCIPGEQYGAVGQRIDGDGYYAKGTARG